jgi:hypothetical protein
VIVRPQRVNLGQKSLSIGAIAVALPSGLKSYKCLLNACLIRTLDADEKWSWYLGWLIQEDDNVQRISRYKKVSNRIRNGVACISGDKDEV